MPSPEELAREKIDLLLEGCGWLLQNRSTINLSASRGVALREALLKGRDEVDYLLFVEGKALGTVEAKPEGHTLIGVEEQSGKYGKNLFDVYGKWRDPLPFAYESTGVETQFTNRLDPDPKSRSVFALHRPETLLEWLKPEHQLEWLEKMRDYISASGSVDREHLEADNVLGPIYKAFGEKLWPLMDELNLTLAA